MAQDDFEDGYRDGWMSIAGDNPLPTARTQPPPDEERTFQSGFEYGRADATMKFQPGREPRPIPREDRS